MAQVIIAQVITMSETILSSSYCRFLLFISLTTPDVFHDSTTPYTANTSIKRGHLGSAGIIGLLTPPNDMNIPKFNKPCTYRIIDPPSQYFVHLQYIRILAQKASLFPKRVYLSTATNTPPVLGTESLHDTRLIKLEPLKTTRWCE